MSIDNIIRAWKDPVYRNSLSENQRALLPPNPAGTISASKGSTTRTELPKTSNPIACTGMCSLNHTGICKTSPLLCTPLPRI